VARFHRSTGVPVYANSGTIEALERGGRPTGVGWKVFTTGQSFQIGDLTIAPFSVPHDAYDPVGFVVADGAGARAGIATDIGTATSLVRERLRDCGVVVIESNHDEQMLRDAARPWHLKQRIAGRQGHLSNRQAGELLAELAGSSTQAVFLSHLSSACNTPQIALQTVTTILSNHGLASVAVHLTYPDRVSIQIVVGK
jgi:phosphoribosyl 1,2-cyclic phosphodiesterase